MKKILAILLCGVMMLGLTGCGKTENEFDVGDKSDIQISQKDVTLSIKDGTLTNTSATLILKNDSDVDVQYGNPYGIEIKQDNEWHDIDINVELTSTVPAYWIKPGESKEIEISWENVYGKLSAGEYRILKGISIEKEEGSFEDFVIAAEFTIK
jgi:hypothetical protein